MGKHLRQDQSTSTPDFIVHGTAGGCTWNIFHVFRYHHWRNIKTRLPHRRRRHSHGGTTPPPAAQGDDDIDTSGTDSAPEQKKTEQNYIGSKMSKTPPSAMKYSVRARLLARITDELSKRKGRHHRSSTCPARPQLIRSESFHHLKISDMDHYMETKLDNLSPNAHGKRKKRSRSTRSSDRVVTKSPKEPTTSRKNSYECKDGFCRLKVNDSKQTLQKKKPTQVMELSGHASLGQSKDANEYLDLTFVSKTSKKKTTVSKELSNNLQDPICEKEFSDKMGPTKSESIPLCNSLDPGPDKCKLQPVGCDSTENICKQSAPAIAAKHREDGLKINESIIDHSSAVTPKPLRNHHVNRVVVKHFKDLKEKIKHAIKKEKWIARDAILDKIPRRQGFSKDLNENIFNHAKDLRVNDFPRNSNVRDRSLSTYKKRRNYKRTSSLDESLERYCQLYEVSFNTDPKGDFSEKSNLKIDNEVVPSASGPKYLGRIFSSPELGSYCQKSENTSASSDKKCRLALESQPKLIPTVDDNETNLVKKETTANSGEVYTNDLVNLMIGNMSLIELDTDNLRDRLVKSRPLSVEESDQQDDALGSAEFYKSEDDELARPDELYSLENLQHQLTDDTAEELQYELNLEKVQILKKSIHSDILRDQVYKKDKSKFDYVKEVLDFSGFSKNTSLGAWHSDTQPLDTAMYEEIESCVPLDPISDCTHPALFDLVNEVLIGLWESSYAYYPKPLSSLSHIRPMPVGYHVLEEVWAHISWYSNSIPDSDLSLDYVVSRDLSKNNGWMNLQFDMECVGFELEDLIFEELLEEVIGT
ncbi:hypothetical protein ACFE04_012800 [Oxalis oulophora]